MFRKFDVLEIEFIFCLGIFEFFIVLGIKLDVLYLFF